MNINRASARHWIICVALLAICDGRGGAQAAEEAGATALIGERGKWVKISESLLTNLAKQDVRPNIKFKYDATPGAGSAASSPTARCRLPGS